MAHRSMKRAAALGLSGIMNFEDLKQEGSIAFIQAQKSFDPEKGKWSTYLGRAVQNQINLYIDREARLQTYNIDEEDSASEVCSHGSTPEGDMEAETLLRAISKRLSPKAQIALRATLAPSPDLERLVAEELEAYKRFGIISAREGSKLRPPAFAGLVWVCRYVLPSLRLCTPIEGTGLIAEIKEEAKRCQNL